MTTYACTNVAHNEVSCLAAGLDKEGTRDQLCSGCQHMAAAPSRHLAAWWRERSRKLRRESDQLNNDALDLERELDRLYPASKGDRES